MGLSFHYSGAFKKRASLAGMIEEVKEIAEVHKWKYSIYNSDFPKEQIGKTGYDNEIYGISFQPENCEPVWLCFLSNGRMSSPIHLEFYGNGTDKDDREYLYMLSVKTQYAGIGVHLFLMRLFKYISKKYLTRFTLSDEGNYWETEDENILKKNFKRYDNLIDNFSLAAETIPVLEGETLGKYFERLFRIIHDSKGEKDG